MKHYTSTDTDTHIVEILQGTGKFDLFNEDQIKDFLQSGRLLDCAPGETIIEDGEYDCWVYFLISGHLEILKENKVIGHLKRNGDMFGEIGIIDGSPRTASVRAATQSMVLGIDASIIDNKLKTNDLLFCYSIYRLFAEVLAARFRNTLSENTRLQQSLATCATP